MTPREIRKKIEENGRAFLAGVAVLSFLIAFIVFAGKLWARPQLSPSEEEDVSVQIDLSFLEDPSFLNLKVFEPSGLPEDKGRSLPFTPYNKE